MVHEGPAARLRRRGSWFLMVPAILLSLTSGSLRAQRLNEVTLDVRPFGASIGFARRAIPGVYFGIAAGGGIDWLDRTFAPDPTDQAYHAFEQVGHISAFLRQKPTESIDLDLGIRIGMGGVRECVPDDCRPGAFVGLTAGAFWGSTRVKIGPRVLWALAREAGQSNPVVYAELLTLRIRL